MVCAYGAYIRNGTPLPRRPTFNPPRNNHYTTNDDGSIASVIEYFLEKFMCVMHLRLELDNDNSAAGPSSKAAGASAGGQKPGQGHPYHRGSSRSLEPEEGGEGEGGGKGWASDGEEGDENDDRQAEFLAGGGGDRGDGEGGGAFTDPFDAAAGGHGRRDSADFGVGGGSSGSFPPMSPPPPEPCASPPPAPSHYVQRGLDPAAKAKLGAWGAALAASGQGVLFEAEGVLQVLCRQEFHGHQGHLQLLYKNLGAAPLEGFHATASSNTAGACF